MKACTVGLPVLALGVATLLSAGCDAKGDIAQAAASAALAQDAPQSASTASLETASRATTVPSPNGSGPGVAAPEASRVAAPPRASAAPSDAGAALQSAMDQKKYLFVSFYKPGDSKGEEVRKTFAEAEGPLSQKALFYAANVSDPKEQALVTKYQVNRAPLPLTLAFAENGAIVNVFRGTAMDLGALSKSFVSPKMAEVQKGFQDRKVMLLCVRGKSTQHNAESVGAARALLQEGNKASAINIVEVAPEDSQSSDLLKQLRVDTTLKEATVFVLVPPSNLAGKVEGATTKEALWQVILKGVSACGGGSCCPSPATSKK